MNLRLALYLVPLAMAGAPLCAQAPDAVSDEAAPLADTANEEVIDTRQERYSRLTVPVLLEGAGPFDFLIDTGAQATAITQSVTEDLALEPTGRAMLVGMASSAVVDLVDIETLKLGSRSFAGIRAPVLERANVGADGIIGLDSLQDLRVLLDFRDRSIAVASKEELGGNRGYEIVVRARRRDGQLLLTHATIDGVRTTVIVDTGSQGSIGNMALRKRLRTRAEGTHVSTDVLGNQITGNVGLVRELRIGGMELNNLAIAFADTPAFRALGLDNKPTLALGIDHLRLFDRVAIDFAERRVLFDLPKEVDRQRLAEIFPGEL